MECLRDVGVAFNSCGVLEDRNRHLVEAGQAEGLENSGAGEGNRILVISLGS